ncbi:MAG TPA: hypothetical protein VF658_20985 [Pyrinomonadaceae bacterium]|jgi:hypothetical protein
MDKTWLKTSGGESFFSTSYFTVLHRLIEILAFEDLGLFLRTIIRKSYSLPTSSIAKVDHKCLERLSINERRELLSLAKRIIEDWSGYFAELEALIKEVMPRYRQSKLRYLMDDTQSGY